MTHIGRPIRVVTGIPEPVKAPVFVPPVKEPIVEPEKIPVPVRV